MNEFKKVVAYIRVSTDLQELSLEAQQYKLSAFCQFHNLMLVNIFSDEDTSGRLPLSERKGGKTLLSYLDENRGTHGVVALRVDRMFRNDIDGLSVADSWAEKGITFYASDVAGNTVNVKTSTGRLMFTIMLAFAVYESARISERTKDAMNVKKRSLRKYGQDPYGFMSTPDGKLIHNEPEMDIVKIIYNFHNEGLNYDSIARQLNEMNVRSKKAKSWYGVTIKNILTNQIYNDVKAELIATRKHRDKSIMSIKPHSELSLKEHNEMEFNKFMNGARKHETSE